MFLKVNPVFFVIISLKQCEISENFPRLYCRQKYLYISPPEKLPEEGRLKECFLG